VWEYTFMEQKELDPQTGEHYLVQIFPNSPKSEVVIDKAGPKVVKFTEVNPALPSYAGHTHYRRDGWKSWERV
jgi:hypothetical protein